MPFNNKLKNLRVQNNLTQEQMARKLNTTRRTYIYYETGNKYPSEDWLNRIANYFNVEISFLTDEQDEPIANVQPQESFSNKLNELEMTFSFSKRLKNLRLQNNLTQEQLAQKLDITRRTYIYYETGKKYPSDDLLNRIANYFNVENSFLMDEEDELIANAQPQGGFSNKIRELRLQNDLSQEMLSRKLGIATRTYIYYEKGHKYPSIEMLAQMADLFKVSISFLLDGQNDIQMQGIKHGKAKADYLVSELKVLFAGEELSEAEKYDVMEMVQEAYWAAKKQNK